MGETLGKNLFAMPQAFFGEQQLLANLLEILTTNIGKLTSFEQIPDTFLWIEFWSVSRQALQMNPFGPTLREKVLDSLTVMNTSSIPDDQQLPHNLAQKKL